MTEGNCRIWFSPHLYMRHFEATASCHWFDSCLNETLAAILKLGDDTLNLSSLLFCEATRHIHQSSARKSAVCTPITQIKLADRSTYSYTTAFQVGFERSTFDKTLLATPSCRQQKCTDTFAHSFDLCTTLTKYQPFLACSLQRCQ